MAIVGIAASSGSDNGLEMHSVAVAIRTPVIAPRAEIAGPGGIRRFCLAVSASLRGGRADFLLIGCHASANCMAATQGAYRASDFNESEVLRQQPERAMTLNASASSSDRIRISAAAAARQIPYAEPSLAGPPVAVHARRDHRAARPVFLHIGRGAIAHRVGTRIVARDRRRARHSSRADRSARAASGRRRCAGHIGDGRCGLGATRTPGGAVCACAAVPPAASSPAKASPTVPPSQSASSRPPKPDIGPYGLRLPRRGQPRRRCTQNSRDDASLREPGPLARNRYKQAPCGPQPKHPRSPKWKPWRTRSSSACQSAFATCARA